MGTGAIVGSIDVAQVTLYVFWIFFAALLWYIRKEDRREGYPLEHDVTRQYDKDPWLFLASKPTGNPMLSGVGPGAWAERADKPDLAADGKALIAPMSVATEFSIAEGDPDPRGLPVMDMNEEIAGTVSDVWVDRAEQMIRYFQVDVAGGGTALLPHNFCRLGTLGRSRGKVLHVKAIMASHFADVPGTAAPDQITLLEEEKIMAYYGAGTLYATPERQEPLL